MQYLHAIVIYCP